MVRWLLFGRDPKPSMKWIKHVTHEVATIWSELGQERKGSSCAYLLSFIVPPYRRHAKSWARYALFFLGGRAEKTAMAAAIGMHMKKHNAML